MPNSAANTGVNWVSDAWTQELGRVIELLTFERPEVRLGGSPSGTTGDANEAICLEHRLNVGQDSKIWITAPAASWRSLSDRTMRAAGVETSEDDELKDAWRELVAQVVSALGQSIGQRLGWDLECAQIGPASNPTQISYECSAEVVFGADQVYPMTVALSSGLVLAIKESLEEKESSEEAAPAPVADDDRFSMISDVELPVSVSFGRTHLPIRDVLKLNTGSLVELNRMINDTVDIIVNNCVIARGEVVVIDGNYGVRIHQIVSKQERLAVRHNRGSSLTATA